ncbi:MAG: hypothetical protein L0338_06410, partial [Acidobacteria bacterium]|nr:hypothetical protein [Acidobacteriota bacterium]
MFETALRRCARWLRGSCLFVTAAAAVPQSWAAYQYYYTENFASGQYDTSKWTRNGNIGAAQGGGLWTNTDGGALISTVPVPDASSEYEVKTALRYAFNWEGANVHFLRATPDACLCYGPQGFAQGIFYSVELHIGPVEWPAGTAQGTLTIRRRLNGQLNLMASRAVTIPYNNNADVALRSIRTASNIEVYINGVWMLEVVDSSIATGKPGVGAYDANYTATVELGPLDRVAPPQVQLQYSAFPQTVNLQWTGHTDDPNGTGVWLYDVFRNPWTSSQVYLGRFGPQVQQFTDSTVNPATTYTYAVFALDYHYNWSGATPITVTTPPITTGINGSPDPGPRRVGVRPTGSYWGAAGEQIDVMSGNLNYTVPVLKAQGRGGWGVPFALSYNSQLWRHDSGGTWKLGADVGYGFGWRLQAGSLLPVWSGPTTIHHYLFVDSSGAEYWLNQWNGSVWTSGEGIYLAYEAALKRLYFPDGSFWVMDCTSAGGEQDAGTLYPTRMQDTNGNQILIRYQAGAGAGWTNSSARIEEIEDVRAVLDTATGRYRTWKFTYNNDPTRHLTAINNYIGTSETYAFNYLANQNLIAPVGPGQSFGTTHLLASLIDTVNRPTSFQYLSSGSGELEKVTFWQGGYLRWNYGNFTNSESRTIREVSYRYLAKAAGAAETWHAFNSPGAGTSVLRSSRTLSDNTNVGEKVWWFNTSGPSWQLGLVTGFEQRQSPSGAALEQRDFAWTQDAASNPYLASVVTMIDPGQSYQKQSKTEQALDANGNVLWTRVYPYGDLTTAVRTTSYTYLNTSNYTSRYINNRLASATVTGAGQTLTLVNNQYDVNGLTNRTGLREHDSANYSTTFTYRGNLNVSTRFGSTRNTWYDITGAVVSSNDGQGHTVSYTPDASKNYAVPSLLTPNTESNLATSFSYTAALAVSSTTGPNNSNAQMTYDSYGRLQQSQSPHGGSTTYAYTNSPPAVTETTGTRWTRTTMDGLGRTIRAETGDGSGTKSIVDTEYEPCACSPLGKVKRVSQPYLPGTPSGSILWTTYTYDALGRTTRADLAGGSGSTTYLYQGNATTVTDPAGKWKRYTRDVLGNLVKVEEPDPALGANFETNYAYNVLNRLTGVTMPRPSGTQTRAFVYDSNQRVQSVSHPESGTSTFTYYADGTAASRTDALGQRTEYSYDGFQRVTQLRHYPSPGVEDLCQRVNLYYDSNPFDAAFSGASWGRLVARQWFVPTGSVCANGQGQTVGYRFTEMFQYSASGLATAKRLYLRSDTSWPNASTILGVMRELLTSYNSYGQRVSMRYPDFRYYNYQYDTLLRPARLTDTDGNDLIKDVTYNEAEQLTGLKNLAGAYEGQPNFYQETRTYNGRQQLTRLTAILALNPGSNVDVEYRYSTTQNNGQVTQEKDWVSGEEITYQYDSLNRLMAAATTGPEWGLAWSYDGFGNRLSQTLTKGTGPTSALAISGVTNRIVSSGYVYDANGNVTALPGQTLRYDAENRLVEVTSGSFGTERYGYNPNNERVYKLDANGSASFFMYSPAGEWVETFKLVTGPLGPEPAPERNNIYFAGRRARVRAHAAGVEKVEVTDRVGSTRMQGWIAGGYAYRDLLRHHPYGEDRLGFGNGNFATYFRDSSTGLDYAINRYYGSNMGRFLTPDQGPPLLANPSSWNRYTYSWNDPINYNDPNGLLPARVIIDGSSAP